MKLLGIEFAPLNVPLERRIQTLVTAITHIIFIYGGVIGITIMYLLFWTKLWWLVLLYLCWMYWDRNIQEVGGRRAQWLLNLPVWKYLTDFFPMKMYKDDSLVLNPSKNYMFTYFPHGYVATGVVCAFVASDGALKEMFPHHTAYPSTLNIQFRFPLLREYILAIKMVSASENSLNWVLGGSEGGRISVLLPGGAAEAYNCTPRCYKVVAKIRKGFVRVAMQNGASLVPVIGYGETDIYTVLDTSKIPIVSVISNRIRKLFGFAPLLANGRGFFQYTYGLIPKRSPINVYFGPEFKIDKNIAPSKSEINEVHGRYCEYLCKVFEDNKRKYLADSENIHMEL